MKRRAIEAELENPEQGLQELFVEQIKDLYSAENQLVKALPKMAKAASSAELKSAFEEHLQVTQQQVNRLEKILSDLDESLHAKKCEGMKGLITEGEETIKKKDEEANIKDAGLIAAAQRVEHYEIAGYGTVRTFAEKLGLSEAVELLQQTLDEEKEADQTLTSISESLLEDEGGAIQEDKEIE